MKANKKNYAVIFVTALFGVLALVACNNSSDGGGEPSVATRWIVTVSGQLDLNRTTLTFNTDGTFTLTGGMKMGGVGGSPNTFTGDTTRDGTITMYFNAWGQTFSTWTATISGNTLTVENGGAGYMGITFTKQ